MCYELFSFQRQITGSMICRMSPVWRITTYKDESQFVLCRQQASKDSLASLSFHPTAATFHVDLSLDYIWMHLAELKPINCCRQPLSTSIDDSHNTVIHDKSVRPHNGLGCKSCKGLASLPTFIFLSRFLLFPMPHVLPSIC